MNIFWGQLSQRQGALQAGIAIGRLAEAAKKPFRPLWISQNSRIWLNETPCFKDLEFTPLILVSASIPNSRQRQSHSKSFRLAVGLYSSRLHSTVSDNAQGMLYSHLHLARAQVLPPTWQMVKIAPIKLEARMQA